MSEHLAASRYRLSVAGGHAPLVVTSFHGTEAISQPFVFTLQVVCADPALEARTLMYRPAFLALDDHGAGFHGQIHSAERCHYQPGPACFRLTLGPRLACLAQRYTPRVFQHMSATAIIIQVLGEHGIHEGSYRFHLKKRCIERRFCAQYHESDLQLLQRLCAEEGIHYHFAHSPHGHRLIFGSGLFGTRRSPPAPWCAGAEAVGVSEFSVCHPGAADPDDLLQAYATGRSSLGFVGSGRLLPLTGHPHARWNRLWRITQVEHRGEEVYRNRFMARSWDAPVQVPAVAAVALPALMRAWVAGLGGQPAEADAEGRIRVQFAWVMQGNGARFADCWLPLQVDVPGGAHGGMEVLVSPSRESGREPQIIACLHAGATALEPEPVGPLQARLDTAWLLGEQAVLSVQNGPEVHLQPGAQLTVQVGACQVLVDSDGLTLSGPGLTFTHSTDDPAVVAAQPPGEVAQAESTQQGEEQEGQP